MTIQIFILTKLMEGKNYPYKIKKQLSEPIPFDQLAGLTESKLYYHFDSLAKQGLIKTVEIIKEEHRPDKQIFEITAKGREELPKKIYKLFETADSIGEMMVGLANIKYVDQDKAVAILEEKLKNSKAKWEYYKSFEQLIEKDKDNEKLIEFLGGYVSAKAEHAFFWLDKLIGQIREGKI
ncbi:PadR family transcriptional regulator [Cytobacillus pseudoceanisediminis]|uniref:PadR family transcriptional regulator n=1 Tax=Cytobacillus pseudoceanisediminis TaxID=3051614 RepID=UPI002163117D|nr:PadR family transcriptional regulator [Cytobacillus firmus]